MSNAAIDAAGPRTETFAVPMGRYLGYFVVGLAALLVVLSIVSHDSTSLALAGFAIAGALVSWVVLIRPEVTAHSNGLLMRNMLRDTFVPWASIKSCRVAATLQIATRDRVYHGLGISKSARAANKERRQLKRKVGGPMLGFSPIKFMSTTTFDSNQPNDAVPRKDFLAQEYAINNNFMFAEQRIESLAMKGAAATREQNPAVVWDRLSVGALLIAVLAVVAAVTL